MNVIRLDDATAGNVCGLTTNEVHFGFGLEPVVNQYLQKAASRVASYDSALEALNKARSLAPNRLEVMVALYKFHCYRGDINEAQGLVFQTLIKSSIKGGFKYDWKELTQDDADWHDARGPARIYLYSLKALAFIRLRQHDLKDARSILNVLERLDPEDQVGAGVVRELWQGMMEDADD